MCLGIPGEIVEVEEHTEPGGLLQGVVSFGGVRKRICLAYVPEAKVGEYAIVHAGFALQLLDEAQARAVFDTLAEADRLLDEAAGGVDGPDSPGGTREGGAAS